MVSRVSRVSARGTHAVSAGSRSSVRACNYAQARLARSSAAWSPPRLLAYILLSRADLEAMYSALAGPVACLLRGFLGTLGCSRAAGADRLTAGGAAGYIAAAAADPPAPCDRAGKLMRALDP